MEKTEELVKYFREKCINNIDANVPYDVREKMLCFDADAMSKAFESGLSTGLKLNNQWIMVEDKLPKEWQKVFIVKLYHGGVQFHETTYSELFVKDGIWKFGDDKVIAWRPIPSIAEIINREDIKSKLKEGELKHLKESRVI